MEEPMELVGEMSPKTFDHLKISQGRLPLGPGMDQLSITPKACQMVSHQAGLG